MPEALRLLFPVDCPLAIRISDRFEQDDVVSIAGRAINPGHVRILTLDGGASSLFAFGVDSEIFQKGARVILPYIFVLVLKRRTISGEKTRKQNVLTISSKQNLRTPAKFETVRMNSNSSLL